MKKKWSAKSFSLPTVKHELFTVYVKFLSFICSTSSVSSKSGPIFPCCKFWTTLNKENSAISSMSPNASASSKPVMDIEKRYSGQWCHKNCKRGKVEYSRSLHKIETMMRSFCFVWYNILVSLVTRFGYLDL